MKKAVALLLCVLMLLTVVACAAEDPIVQTDAPLTEDNDPASRAYAWVEKQLANDTLFAFNYDTVDFTDHIKSWEKKIDKGEDTWTLTYRKDGLVAWSEIVLDRATASVEWTNYFKNEGSSDSLVIRNIDAVNTTVAIKDPTLTTAESSAPSPIDFQPIVVDLKSGKKFTEYTDGGRSSQAAFPYFDISNGECGVFAGIGWTGDWRIAVDYDKETELVSIAAGMKNTKIALHAGEQMRTPMFMLMFYDGNEDDGHNAFRQLILANYTPKDENGETIQYAPLFTAVSGGLGEDGVIAELERVQAEGRPVEGLWFDATWYGYAQTDNSLGDGSWVAQVGNWFLIPSAYPNGNMNKVNRYLDQNDMEFLMWFEPERAAVGTQLINEHPDYVYNTPVLDVYRLVKFSDDRVCEYMANMVSKVIQTNGVDWYRQDFNIDPAQVWKEADELEGENRVGMTEIKYITNLYRYLDLLKEKNPNLKFDNCASGGKRLDLEMMKRSIPLWRTDITCADYWGSTPDNVRSINYNLSWWLPVHAGGYPEYNGQYELYNMRSYLSSGTQVYCGYDNNRAFLQSLDEFLVYREMMAGEYYILARGFDEEIETEIAAYEYYLPEEGRGFMMTFRPADCENVDKAVHVLKGLDAQANYEITVADTGQVFTMTGEQLMTDGLGCVYPNPAFSLLIYFNKV